MERKIRLLSSNLKYMEKKDLNKSMYQAVKKALGSKQGIAHAANHIAQDIIDPNMVAETPKNHIPAAKEGVLHKDVSVSEMHQQKQANAQASVGMPPKATAMKPPGMKKIAYGALMVNEEDGMEAPEKGVGKLRKFMEKCSMKKSSHPDDKGKNLKVDHKQKGVHRQVDSFDVVNPKHGQSKAGVTSSDVKSYWPGSIARGSTKMAAINEHKKVIAEQRSMPKPNLPKSEMAKTVPNDVKEVRRKAASQEEKSRGVPRYKTNPDGKSTGPNRPNEGHHYGMNHPWKDKEGSGESVMGHKVRNPAQWVTSAKDDAKSKVQHLKNAPKPNLPKSEKIK